jgi:hypothetical protein
LTTQNTLVLSLSTARKLKEASLFWSPVLHDSFAVPDRGFENRVFATTGILRNTQHATQYAVRTIPGGDSE